jgi:mortality factor 4-like protein 1
MFKSLTSSTEWVHQSRLLKRDETNLALQKKLQQTHRAAIGKDKDPTSHKAKERDPNRDREKERDREPRFPKKELRVKQPRPKEEDFDEIDYQPPPKKKQELKLSVPEVLKVVLVDDWEAVTRHGQLVSLPRSPCVDDILLEFKEYVLELPEADAPSDVEEKLPSVLIGLKQYFDACVHQHQCPDVKLLIRLPFFSSALGANLLYRFERAQYADIRRRFIENPDLPPEQWKSESQIYGAEHLMRLIGRCFWVLGLEVPLTTLVVSLPAQMAAAKMELVAMNTIREYSSLLLQ